MKRRKTDGKSPGNLNMRLDPKVRRQLEKLCDFNASDLSEEVRLAIICRLREFKLWPRDADGSDAAGPKSGSG